MTLYLYFLGQPRIERDGRIIEPDTRKAVALLAYVAITDEFQSRDTLAALLWPEMGDERARAALRRTLSSTRAVVGDDALYVTRDGLSLNGKEVWCDAVAFEEAVAATGRHSHTGSPCLECLSQLEPAVALYRDHFLSGFSLRNSAAFDDWQLVVGEHLRRAYSSALAWLVQAHSQSGEFEKAIDLARRWLAVDPMREEAHRWLMQLHSWSGARDAALRQYREAVRILEEELGVGPLPETTALYEAIQQGRLAPPVMLTPPAPIVASPLAPPLPNLLIGPPSLVGRDSAWEALQNAYSEVAGSGRLAAVVGEAGIGKTRLVETFLEHVRDLGATTVTASCYEGEANLAYAPIAAAMRALWRRPGAAERLAAVPVHWLNEVARLVPELGAGSTQVVSADQTAGPGAQARFFAGISEALCRLLCGDAPGVFFLDDAHWADDASLDLLAYLARRLGDLPVLLVLSWDEVSGMTGDRRRLHQILVEAQRAGAGRLIELSRWRPSDVYGLVTAHESLRPRATEITDRLYRETEGLPYFVNEYLAALADSPDSWAVPQSVRDLLAGRLAGVDQAGRQLLQTGAVIGRSFDYTTLLEASGRSDEEVVSGLEGLLARGLIREIGDEAGEGPLADLRYDFAHQQLRALVYDETNLARRRLLHRRVAAALQARARGPAGEAVASIIGHHYRLGGQDTAAADFYRRAGDHARALYANHEALDHYRTALALGHPDAAYLHEAAADLHTLLGEYGAALGAYELAATLASGADLGRLEHKLGQVYERRGNWELAENHFCAALGTYQAAGRKTELARLNVDRGRVAYRSGDLPQARTLAEEALVLAEVAADPAAEAQARNTLGILARHEGDPVAAREQLERSLALAEAGDMTAARVAALNNLARLHESEGRTDEALALLEQAIAICARQGDRHHEAALYNHRADILHHAWREEDAMTSLKQAVAIYAEIGMEAGDWQPEIWKLTEW
jgi:predicted ATPase/DNA-binding SARP family transcriptional activator